MVVTEVHRFFLFSVIGLASACASTSIVYDRLNEAQSGADISHVCTLAISSGPAARAAVENALVDSLTGAGVSATPMHTLLLEIPEGRAERIEVLGSGASAAGCDAVLLVSLLSAEVDRDWQPARMEAVNVTYGSGLWTVGDYYHTWQEYVFVPGYYDEYRDYRLFSQLFVESSREPLWEAETSTVDPPSLDSAAASYADAIVAAMGKRGLLQ